MSWIEKEGRRFWVGCHTKIGLVVLDPSGQATDETQVSLYVLKEDRVGVFQRSVIRSQLLPAQISPTEVCRAADAYLRYEINKPQKDFENQTRENRRLLEIKHKNFVAERGQAYSGVRIREGSRRPRASWCWSCKTGLNSSSNLECVTCGWILCECGACGCGKQSIL